MRKCMNQFIKLSALSLMVAAFSSTSWADDESNPYGNGNFFNLISKFLTEQGFVIGSPSPNKCPDNWTLETKASPVTGGTIFTCVNTSSPPALSAREPNSYLNGIAFNVTDKQTVANLIVILQSGKVIPDKNYNALCGTGLDQNVMGRDADMRLDNSVYHRAILDVQEINLTRYVEISCTMSPNNHELIDTFGIWIR